MSEVLSAVGEATGLKPSDVVIAHGLLAAAKMKSMAYCGAVLEAVTPEVRHLLTEQLQASLAGQERMAKLAAERGWYKAHSEPNELLKQAVKYAQPVIS